MTSNPSQGAVQCPRCAAQISAPLAAFCPVCGLALSPAADVPQVASQPPAPPYGQPPAPPYGAPPYGQPPAPPYGQPPAPPYGQPPGIPPAQMPDSYPGFPGQYPYYQPRSTGISLPILAAVGAVALVVILAIAGLVVVAGRGGTPSTGIGAPNTMNIAGSWEDMQTHDVHVIEWRSDRFVVVSVTDLDDGEEMRVTAQSWENDTLTWTYHVPSTGYDVTFVTVSLNGDRLTCQWHGTAGSGTEVLHRVG